MKNNVNAHAYMIILPHIDQWPCIPCIDQLSHKVLMRGSNREEYSSDSCVLNSCTHGSMSSNHSCVPLPCVSLSEWCAVAMCSSRTRHDGFLCYSLRCLCNVREADDKRSKDKQRRIQSPSGGTLARVESEKHVKSKGPKEQTKAPKQKL